jgi:hypothetical protein
LSEPDRNAINDALQVYKKNDPNFNDLTDAQLKQMFVWAVEQDLSITLNKQSYFIEYEKLQHKFKMLLLGKEIGHGKFCSLQRVVDIFEKTVEVLKKARTNVSENSNNLLKNEFTVLQSIQSEGLCWGIKLPGQFHEKDFTPITFNKYSLSQPAA